MYEMTQFTKIDRFQPNITEIEDKKVQTNYEHKIFSKADIFLLKT